MSIKQLLRIVWARKWLVLALLLLVSVAGSVYTVLLPKQYTAESAMVVEMRIDPVLGAIAPSLAAPGYMATQIDILKSERVAARVVKMLGVERSPPAVAQWRDATSAKIPLERYFANLLQRGLQVEPSRGSNVINVSFSAQDPIFAPAASARANPASPRATRLIPPWTSRPATISQGPSPCVQFVDGVDNSRIPPLPPRCEFRRGRRIHRLHQVPTDALIDRPAKAGDHDLTHAARRLGLQLDDDSLTSGL